MPANEAARDLAVERSEAIHARDDAVLAQIVQEARRRFEASISVVSIIHGDAQYMIAADGFATGIYGRRLSLSGHAVAADQDVFCVTDLSRDRRFSENPWVNGERGDMRFYAAVLLRSGAGLALGALSVIRDKPRDALSESEQAVLRNYGNRVMARLAMLRAGSAGQAEATGTGTVSVPAPTNVMRSEPTRSSD